MTNTEFKADLNALVDRALMTTDTPSGVRRIDAAKRVALEYAESGLVTLRESLDLFKSRV